jgi:hypothetical protein
MNYRDISEINDFWRDGNWGFDRIKDRSRKEVLEPTEEEMRDAIAEFAFKTMFYPPRINTENPCV